jgi:hypothetical protein
VHVATGVPEVAAPAYAANVAPDRPLLSASTLRMRAGAHRSRSNGNGPAMSFMVGLPPEDASVRNHAWPMLPHRSVPEAISAPMFSSSSTKSRSSSTVPKAVRPSPLATVVSFQPEPVQRPTTMAGAAPELPGKENRTRKSLMVRAGAQLTEVSPTTGSGVWTWLNSTSASEFAPDGL